MFDWHEPVDFQSVATVNVLMWEIGANFLKADYYSRVVQYTRRRPSSLFRIQHRRRDARHANAERLLLRRTTASKFQGVAVQHKSTLHEMKIKSMKSCEASLNRHRSTVLLDRPLVVVP